MKSMQNEQELIETRTVNKKELPPQQRHTGVLPRKGYAPLVTKAISLRDFKDTMLTGEVPEDCSIEAFRVRLHGTAKEKGYNIAIHLRGRTFYIWIDGERKSKGRKK